MKSLIQKLNNSDGFWSAMAAIAPYALGAGASAYDSKQTTSAQRAANETNERIAKENRDFQERMSNTSYQRSKKDLIAAGYNPILAMRQGGAGTPSGMGATVQSTKQHNPQSAQMAAQLAASIQKTLAETTAIRQQTKIQKPEEEVSSSAFGKFMAYAKRTGLKIPFFTK